MNLLPFTIAQAAPAAAPSGSPLQFPIMMLLLFGVMYFMMIRPQRRRDKARKLMIANVKTGDRVLLTSGFLGSVITVRENSIIVKIADNTKVEVVKAALSQVLEKGETPSEIEPAK
ncbi:MAG: preprotein translocase subunit YajC [Kiritimatiellales bacterium]|nr:preprotein translocase subunit YajC [Kiritimatiellales bacterium]